MHYLLMPRFFYRLRPPMIRLSLLILIMTETVYGLGLDRISNIEDRLANLEKEMKTLHNEVSHTGKLIR